jgi:hypothetical protein
MACFRSNRFDTILAIRHPLYCFVGILRDDRTLFFCASWSPVWPSSLLERAYCVPDDSFGIGGGVSERSVKVWAIRETPWGKGLVQPSRKAEIVGTTVLREDLVETPMPARLRKFISDRRQWTGKISSDETVSLLLSITYNVVRYRRVGFKLQEVKCWPCTLMGLLELRSPAERTRRINAANTSGNPNGSDLQCDVGRCGRLFPNRSDE